MRNDESDDLQAGKIRRQSPLKGFSQIVAGNGLGQLVTFFVLPILSRLYSSEEFGLLSLVLSVAAIVTPLALIGMHLALVQPRNDYEVAPLIFSGFTSLGVISLLTAGVVVFWLPTLGYNRESSVFLFWALPALIFLTGVNLMLNQLVTRSGAYGSLGRRNGIQSISISVAQLALAGTAGLAWFNGLVGGNLVGVLIGVLILLRFLKNFIRKVSVRECIEAIKTFRRFIFVFSPMTSLTLLSQQAAVLFTIYWYGQADGGQVGMAERLVAVPLALIGLAARTVFMGEFSHAVRSGTGDLTQIYLKMSKWFTLLGFVVALGFMTLSPLVLPAFLGNGWETATRVVQIMAVVAGTRIVSNPLRSIFGILGRAKLITIVELIRFSLIAVAIAVAIYTALPLLSALIVIFAVMAVSDIILWVFGLLASKDFDKKHVK